MDELRRWEMGNPEAVAIAREQGRLKRERRRQSPEKIETCAGCRFLMEIFDREACEFSKRVGRRCGLYQNKMANE